MAAHLTISIPTLLCAALLTPASVGAQTAPAPVFTPGAAAVFNPARDWPAPLFDPAPDRDSAERDDDRAEAGQEPFDWKAERRACEGCPRRSVGRALLQTTRGDTSMIDLGELMHVARGGSARIKR